MEQKGQTRYAEELLTALYNRLILYKKAGFDDIPPNTNLSNRAIDDFKSEEVQGRLDSLSEIVDGISMQVDGNSIGYSKSDDSVSLIKNEKYKDALSYMELYRRADLDLDYKLHIVAVERGRDINKGDLDVGMYITNKAGKILFWENLACTHLNRLDYAKKVKELFDRYISLIESGILDLTKLEGKESPIKKDLVKA